MPLYSATRALPAHADNLGRTERWLSVLAGAGLLLSAISGRGAVGRLSRCAAGFVLLSRGAAGYCAVKGALRGENAVGEGLREQWNRLASRTAATAPLDSMGAMYDAELQELYSAEVQFQALAEQLMRATGSAPLAFRIGEYAAELRLRAGELRELLVKANAQPGPHPDDAMRALIVEARKMAAVRTVNVRDAAVAASVRRIVHYKIAGYSAIAAYAKALGRAGEAETFAQFAARDRAIDAELGELAGDVLNPEAAMAAPREQDALSSETLTH